MNKKHERLWRAANVVNLKLDEGKPVSKRQHTALKNALKAAQPGPIEAKIKVIGFDNLRFDAATRLVDELTEKIRELAYPRRHEIVSSGAAVVFDVEFSSTDEEEAPWDDPEKLLSETLTGIQEIVGFDNYEVIERTP